MIPMLMVPFHGGRRLGLPIRKAIAATVDHEQLQQLGELMNHAGKISFF